ncbi:B-cell scaffold protein with ankyrin repeats-like [Canis lupus familiaris]|uniref:B-cell scaffold protein with ankyrin repeats-like n=1 Tax=Canis lupus familiaris TaxID=9615 RepID=UPI0018F6987B|nr:B-cell scaffold protein with ankyrin repeats-like [Canis lupus familiaris]
MLPRASVRAGGRRGPAPPENAKDIIMIYEEDAEEWALYLKEVFLHVVKREAILLYHLENYSFWDLELLSLNCYKCKLLILSNGLLKNLTPKKCQFLEKILHSPESVVTLLCGVKSSDQLYKLLNIAGGRWEISTEQEPQDYIAVIESIVFRGSEDYLQVNIPTDLGVECSKEISKRKEIEELSIASRGTIPLAVVLPAEIPCENPGEIFIILRDEVIGDTVEVEFTSNSKCIRMQPTRWNKTVWCMKALDFPAGSVNVHVYCDGVIKATAEIKYSTTKAVEYLLGVARPGDGVCQCLLGIPELLRFSEGFFKPRVLLPVRQGITQQGGLGEEFLVFSKDPSLRRLSVNADAANALLADHSMVRRDTRRSSLIYRTSDRLRSPATVVRGPRRVVKLDQNLRLRSQTRPSSTLTGLAEEAGSNSVSLHQVLDQE